MLLAQVKRTIHQYRLLEKADRLLVAVSGGPDSVALLHILRLLQEELKISLSVAHLDHMLRSNSHQDKEFVEKLCSRLGLGLTAGCVNLRQLAKKGSLEEAARNVRLDFLFRTAKQVRANKIALGHTLDDQAETVLMRLIRGSGLSGLCGILPKREFRGYQLIRPLIECKRSDVEAFLKQKGIRALKDPTNQEDLFLRNRIRHYLLPLLENKYNPKIKEVLSGTAQSLSLDYDYLHQVAQRIKNRLRPSLNTPQLLKMHPAIRRLILRLRIVDLQGNTRRINLQHIREIEDLLLNRPLHSVVDLPKGIRVSKKKNCLVFTRRKIYKRLIS
jgi:tRNA(Ile)-lysidine synthase